MQDVFYAAIEKDVADEAKDNNKYLELAKMAHTDKERKILLDIAAEEKQHHKYLSEILKDRPVALAAGGDESDN